MATSDDQKSRRALLRQVDETHAHFAELMKERLSDADNEVIERYFGLLSTLVDKLEDDDKSLRRVVQEMITESAAQIFAELT